jgi:hypothetical protein
LKLDDLRVIKWRAVEAKFYKIEVAGFLYTVIELQAW